RALPALNAGTLDAAISISSPDCGLRPFLAERSRTSKLPKPISCTFSPFFKDSWIVLNTASTAAPASFFVRSASSLTALIKSVLFIRSTSLYDYNDKWFYHYVSTLTQCSLHCQGFHRFFAKDFLYCRLLGELVRHTYSSLHS